MIVLDCYSKKALLTELVLETSGVINNNWKHKQEKKKGSVDLYKIKLYIEVHA